MSVTSPHPLGVLLIEDNPGDARLIAEYVREHNPQWALHSVSSLSDAQIYLRTQKADLIFLDLSLPDGLGIDSVHRILVCAPGVPVIVLTGLEDTYVATQAVQAGAQDYLNKNELNAKLLARAAHYALERGRLLETIRALSLRDALTDLYNRRGFLTLAEQQCKDAQRREKSLAVFFIDVDNMKTINDTLGHRAGDRALIAVATALRQSLRDSDIAARLAGDEFALLAADAGAEGAAAIATRIEANVAHAQLGADIPGLSLAVSVGYVLHKRGASDTIEALLQAADAAMYAVKQRKKPAC